MTTDKVQIGDSTTGTTTSTTYTVNSKPSAEYGWVCPRCNRVNAPWKSQCDCSGNYWLNNWETPYYEDWWKRVYCDTDTFRIHPESVPIYTTKTPGTIHKAPSSVCHADSNTAKPTDYENVTAWSNCSTTIDSPDNPWNKYYTETSNKLNEIQNQINDLKETK